MIRFESRGYWDKMNKKKEPVKPTEPFKESLESRLHRALSDLGAVANDINNINNQIKEVDRLIEKVITSIKDLQENSKGL